MFEGIDVSVHQGAINWKAVGASKAFAFIRVGWAGYEGTIKVDARYHENMKNATAEGMKVGVYVYSYCKTPQAARTAAAETLALVRPYTLEYPIAFDIEDPMHVSMARRDNTDIAAAFLSAIQAAGYYAMLYTYKSFATDHLIMSELGAYDFWLAQYAAKPTHSGPYGIWQYTGKGRCDGIGTDVDLNTAYKDYAAIIRGAGMNRLTLPKQPEPTAGMPEEKPEEDTKEKYRTALIEAGKLISAALGD